MSANYKNFFENLEEAQRRLLNTTVTYEGIPVHIFAITNHKPDGIFRVYSFPVRDGSNIRMPRYQDFGQGAQEQGAYLDKYMEENKDCVVTRKHINSPAFNKFRPFKLGMINQGGSAVYLERSPERRTYQGLVSSMIRFHYVGMPTGTPQGGKWGGSVLRPEFHDCVLGLHPSAEECLENLLDPSVENDSVAFHRDLAFARGPLDLLFLQYKNDVVGTVPLSKRPSVELAKKFAHLKETIEETKQFHDIRVRG